MKKVAYDWQKPNGFEIPADEIQFLDPSDKLSPEMQVIIDRASEASCEFGARLLQAMITRVGSVAYRSNFIDGKVVHEIVPYADLSVDKNNSPGYFCRIPQA